MSAETPPPDDPNVIGGIRIAGDRPIPDGTVLRLEVPGISGHVRAYVRLPWQHVFTDLGLLPIVNRLVTLPLRLVFLCHAKEDKAVVEEVGNRLLQDGFLTWYDEKDLLPGDPWERKIEEAIETSDFVMVFLSTASCGKTGYVQREVRIALEQHSRRPLGQRFIIPVLIDDCAPPREFGSIQYLRLWEHGAYERLKRALTQGSA